MTIAASKQFEWIFPSRTSPASAAASENQRVSLRCWRLLAGFCPYLKSLSPVRVVPHYNVSPGAGRAFDSEEGGNGAGARLVVEDSAKDCANLSVSQAQRDFD